MIVDEQQVMDKLRVVLAELIDLGQLEPITAQTPLEDLGLDSMGLVEMATYVSDDLGVEISDEDLASFHTVGDVLNRLLAC